MPQLKIRRYKKSDNKTVWNLHTTGLKQNNAYILKGKWDEDLNNIEKVYLKNGEFLIGEINGKIVAMGAFKKVSEKKAEIKRMRVHRDYQKKGFGQTILDELEKRAAKMGYKILRLDTTDRQKSAQKFFEKNGYIKTKSKIFSEHDFEMIFYEKKLSD